MTMHFRTGLIGGTSSDLDGIDGVDLIEGDCAIVVAGDGASPESTVVYFYVLTTNGGGSPADNPPATIAPDTNPSTKLWKGLRYIHEWAYVKRIRKCFSIIAGNFPS